MRATFRKVQTQPELKFTFMIVSAAKNIKKKPNPNTQKKPQQTSKEVVLYNVLRK